MASPSPLAVAQTILTNMQGTYRGPVIGNAKLLTRRPLTGAKGRPNSSSDPKNPLIAVTMQIDAFTNRG